MRAMSLWLCVSALLLVSLQRADAAERPDAEALLHAGQLQQGEAALTEYLQQKADDDQARFGLGVLQFVRSVEHLGQSLHRYGLRHDGPLARNIPFLRLPVPPNPAPEKLTYELSRKVGEQLLADLAKAEATFAAIRDEKVTFALRPGLIRIDLDGDGKPEDPFELILVRYFGGPANNAKIGALAIQFDRGDAAWFRGYCHLLSGLAEFALAHDGQELFDHTAHLFFSNVEATFKLPDRSRARGADITTDILDAIAFIHLLRLPVKEPARLAAALKHFEQMLALSRESWKFILAETDDDREWLPNPQQTGVLELPIQREQIDAWLEFVGEAEALLAGKRLAPYWRDGNGRGINVRRVFTEPRTFDLVLWVQGSAAVPYLEAGELTRRDVWDRLLRVFGGEFVGFALWFN